MASKGIPLPWRGNGGTISLNLVVIWEMPDNMITSGAGGDDETLISYCRADRSRVVDMARRIDGRRRAAARLERRDTDPQQQQEKCHVDTDLAARDLRDWERPLHDINSGTVRTAGEFVRRG